MSTTIVTTNMLGIAIQAGVGVVPCGLDTFQWSFANRRRCALVWGDPIDLSALPRNGRGYKEGAMIVDEAILGLWRQAAEAVVEDLPDTLPDGAVGHPPLRNSQVNFIDAVPWPDDEWAKTPLGPVYPGRD